MLKRSLRVLFIACLALLTSDSQAHCDEVKGKDEAQASDENSTKPEKEFVILQLELRDSDEQPIVGASVRPYGLRSPAAEGSHFFWNPNEHGPSTGISSNAEGNVDLKIPKFVFPDGKTSEVSVVIQHEDFIEAQNDFPIGKKPIRISMERGLKYRVRGIDSANGQPIRSRLFGEFSGRGSGNEWKPLDDGTLRSVAVTDARKAMWLFHVPDSGPVLFSDVFLLSQLDGNEFEKQIPDLTLRPGHRLEGRLDDTVERPVKSGHVVLQACTSISDEDSRLTWNDFAKIKEDGSFVFDSVPRDCIVMLVAVCDGGLSGAALTDELAAAGVPPEDYAGFQSASQVVPYVVRSTGESSEIVIPMGQTATVSVSVVDAENKPLAGAEVSMWPNQFFPGSGSNIIGDAWSTSRLATLTQEQRVKAFSIRESDADKDPVLSRVRTNAYPFYVGKTDAEGKVTLKSLPGSSDAAMPLTQEVSVQRKGYQVPDVPKQVLGGNVSVKLVAGQTTELTVVMVPEKAEAAGDSKE